MLQRSIDVRDIDIDIWGAKVTVSLETGIMLVLRIGCMNPS